MYSFNHLSDKKVKTSTINVFQSDSAGNCERPVVLSNIVLNSNRVSLCKSNANNSINDAKSSLKKNIDACTNLTTRLSCIEKENIDKLFSIDEDDICVNERSTQKYISPPKDHQDMIVNRPPTKVREFSSLPTQNIIQSHHSSPSSKYFKDHYPKSRGDLLRSPCFGKNSNDFEKSLVNVTDNCLSMSDTNFFSQEHELVEFNDDVEEIEDSIIVISSDDSMDNSIIDNCNIFDEQATTEEVNKSFTLDNLTSFPLRYESEEYIKQELNSPIIIYDKKASRLPPFHMENKVITEIEDSIEHNATELKSFNNYCSNSVMFIKDEPTHGFYIKQEESTCPSTLKYFQEPQNHLMTMNDDPMTVKSRAFVSGTHKNYLSVLGEKTSYEFSNKTFQLKESKVKSEIDTLETIIKKAATGSRMHNNFKSLSRPSLLPKFKRLHPTKMLSNYSCEYQRAYSRKDLQPIIYIELD